MIRVACAMAFALTCMSTQAMSEDCGPLKQITSLDLVPAPSGLMLVPVSINGTPQQMALATAGGISTLRQDAMDRLGLHPIDASHIRLLSGNGTASQSFVQVDFGLGALHDPDLQLIVMPEAATPPPPFVGSLAGDFLSLNDAEIDLAGRKLNIFSKDHCPGHVLYWHPTAVAVVPITLQIPTGDDSRTGFRRYSIRGSHINVPVSIDGKDFKAAINTAAAVSSMSADTAKFIFGVTADSPGSVPVKNGDADPNHARFIHTFSSLTFDTVTVTNPRFLIYPIEVGSRDPNNSGRTDTRVHRIDDDIHGDITIGMDVLRKLRLYVAYGERKLYVTPATAPVPPTNTAVPAQ